MPRASLGWRSTSSGPPENVPVPSRLELPLRVALASEAWPSEVYAPFALPAAAARYVFGVHRARVGSRLRLLDGASREADAEVLDPSNGLVRIVEVFLVERSTRPPRAPERGRRARTPLRRAAVVAPSARLRALPAAP